MLFGGSNTGKKISEVNRISKIGEEIGLLFQLTDDFLDIKGSSRLTGKSVKKDKKKGKSTMVNLMGFDFAQKYAINLKTNILRNLKKHGKKANDLKNLINFILERKY